MFGVDVDIARRDVISASMNDFQICHKIFLLCATKNARLSNADRLMEILVELYDISWDVILFTETRRASGIFQFDSDNLYGQV